MNLKLRAPSAAGLAAILACICSSASADDVTIKAMPSAHMTVTIDKETGRARAATAQEAAALRDQPVTRVTSKAASTNGLSAMPATPAEARLTRRRLKDGTEVMQVPLSTMIHLQATRDAQGNVTIQHAAPAPGESDEP